MVFAVIVVLILGITTGAVVDNQYPQVGKTIVDGGAVKPVKK